MGREPESTAGVFGAVVDIAREATDRVRFNRIGGVLPPPGKYDGVAIVEQPQEQTRQPERRKRNRSNISSFMVPLCLLQSVYERRSVDLIVAYCVSNRAKHKNLSIVDMAQQLDIRMTPDTVAVLVNEAERMITDYRALTPTGDWPRAKIQSTELLKAFNGNMTLEHFCGWCAVKSYVDLNHQPAEMTVEMIRRRMAGYHSVDTWKAAGGERYTVSLNRFKVRRMTLALVRSGLVLRATVMRSTFYFLPGYAKSKAKAKGMTPEEWLHDYAKNEIAERRSRVPAMMKQDRDYTKLCRYEILQRSGVPVQHQVPVQQQVTDRDREVAQSVLGSPVGAPYTPGSLPKYSTSGPLMIDCHTCGKQHPDSEPCAIVDMLE